MIKRLSTALLLAFSVSSFSREVSITLEVPPMDCVTCPITVEKALDRVDGVKSVSVTFDEKIAEVTFDDDITNAEALIIATTNAGYPSVVKVN